MSTLPQRLDNLVDLIEQAIALVQNNTMVNLSGFDDQVQALCREIEASPPAIAHDAEESMLRVISRLEALAIELHAYQERADSKKTVQ